MQLPEPDAFSSYADAGFDRLVESQVLLDMDDDDYDLAGLGDFGDEDDYEA